MDAKDFLAGRSRETRIRRDARGRWFDGDDAIEHPGLRDAFDRWIARADDGRYCLRNDINWAYVQIEGPPLFVRTVRVVDGAVMIGLSDGLEEVLHPETLRQAGDGSLYADARGGTMPARFERAAMHSLESCLGEEGGQVFLSVGGRRYFPPAASDPLVPVK